jgi:hypothetical protein
MQVSEDPAFSGATWNPVASPQSWTFAADGEHYLYARFSDAAGTTSTPVNAKVVIDTVSPAIDDVRVVVTGTTATITWSTNEAADALIDVGLAVDYGTAHVRSGEATSHTVTVTGLSPLTAYHYRITSKDLAGNPVATGDLTIKTGHEVGGVLASNTRWTVADSPVIVTDTLTVPSGVSLEIAPGVDVRFNGLYSIVVDGEMKGIGMSTAPLRFTSNQSSPAPGDWRAIRFRPSSVDASADANHVYLSGSIIAYADISFGGGIFVESASPYIANNHLYQLSEDGASVGLPMGAIRLCQSAAVVAGNWIERNAVSGISASSPSGAILIANIIESNRAAHGGGLILAPPDCDPDASVGGGEIAVENNIVLRNSAAVGGGILVSSGAPSIRHNVIGFNSVDVSLAGGGVSVSAGAAVAVLGGATPIIEYNVITNNAGIEASSAAVSLSGGSHATLQRNIISNLAGTSEIHLAPDVIADIDASNNYWGTVDVATIRSRLWEHDQNPQLAHILVEPVLESSDPAAGPYPDAGGGSFGTTSLLQQVEPTAGALLSCLNCSPHDLTLTQGTVTYTFSWPGLPELTPVDHPPGDPISVLP